MPLTIEDIHNLESAGVSMPDWVVEAHDRSQDVSDAVPMAVRRLTRADWNPDLDDVENLYRAGMARLLKAQAGDLTEYLDSLANDVLLSALRKHSGELLDHALTALREVQARLTDVLAVPGVTHYSTRDKLDIGDVPKKLVEPILTARATLATSTRVLQAVCDLFRSADVPLGYWLYADPAPIPVADWITLSPAGMRGSARPRGQMWPVLSNQLGGALVGATLPSSMSELRKREQMVVTAERNSHNSYFYDDDQRTIGQLAALSAPRPTPVRTVERTPPATTGEFAQQYPNAS